MKKFTFLLLLFLVISCQNGILNVEDSSSFEEINPAEVETVLVDEPFVFLSETDFFKWSHIDKLEDRFKACEIPENQLKIMTTEALLKSILHYPLNYLIFAYNSSSQAIDLIMANSSLHKEFVTRPDVSSAFLNIFSKTSISFDSAGISKDYTNLSYVDEICFEYFIASDYINCLQTLEQKNLIKTVVEEKIKIRLEDEQYSVNSILPLIKISENKGLGIENRTYSTIQENPNEVSLHTPFGHILCGIDFPEYSPAEIVSITDCYEEHYPYAIVYRPASNQYNCHFFAWEPINPSGGNHWLNPYYGSIFQLSYFWTNDLFVNSTESEAEKVHYYQSDHSAIVLSSEDYISKWGNGPVMVHAPEYGPYNFMAYRHYYKTRTDLPANIIQITGDSIVSIGEANYYIQTLFSNSDMTYVWSVRYWNDSTNPYDLQQIVGDEYELICYDYGTFTIRVDGYYNGNHVAYGEKNINCIPDF
ncbi:MAG: hypothetical protein Q4G10_04040 [Bacteroidia bacterium]|nr:hypothetical protein [Bacteroidia bacterium]